jgi:outer membrane protein
MIKRGLAAVVAVAACLAWGTGRAQEMQIGFVDVDRIFEESRSGQQSRSDLDGEAAGYNRRLEDITAEARKIQEELDKNALTMSEREREQRERRLADLKVQFERRKQEYAEEFEEHRQSAIRSLLQRVEQVVARIAQADQLDVVVGRAVAVGSRADITKKVIQAMDEAEPQGK